MADKDIRKRLNYYTGLFLQEEDFKAEQSYHVEQQKEQNKLLLTPGIIDPNTGLVVTVSPDKTKVTVSAGVAIDVAGNQLIVLEGDTNRKDISTTAATEQDVFLTLSSQELITDAPAGGTGTRIFAQPKFELIPIANPPSEDVKIRLVQLKIGSAGIIGTPDLSVRKTAGVRVAGGLGGLKVGATEVRNPGGTIELVQGGAIVLTPNNATKQIAISETHSSLRNNPHTVTAAQVGALPLAGGGNVTGNVQVTGNVNVRSATGSNTKLDVQTTSPGLTGTPGAAFVWNGSGAGSCGLVAKMTTTPTSAPNPLSAAVAGIGIAGIHGVYATAPIGTHALSVDGTARITGQISTTHLVDTFINASGRKLKTGDVIKLKGTPVTRFRGLNNKAPVAEVTLADRENDPLVIGIVDCEAIPDSGSPDTRIKPEDPTFIENGGELYVVTLGTFAHCKVDASEAPIEVGDLLTSSKNLGHAKKATKPQIGSIIGKALEPLKQGTGYIAVFVNIQ
jgi:hypothetical protein